MDAFGYKIDIFHISCAIALFFIILVLELEGHCYFVRKDGSFTVFIESPKLRNNSRIIATYPDNLLLKNVDISFLNMLCSDFSLEAVLQGMAKNNPTEKQIEAKVMKRH